MNPDLMLTGRVIVVTGAGRGLGRAYARTLAADGANVVVNDLGGAVDGAGRKADGDPGPAETVAADIRAAGGRAVSCNDSVTTQGGADRIVETAMSEWGRVDALVINAGNLRNASMRSMTLEDFTAVVDVHLIGTFTMAKAVWPIMEAQGHGRIVATTSGSGLYGNVRQANYSAAKAGVMGMVRALAIEGARSGITANGIAPMARSRMTEDLLADSVKDRAAPEWVAPLVAVLCSAAHTATGQIWSAGSGYYSRAAVVEGPGVDFDEVPTAQALARVMADAGRLGGAVELGSVLEWVQRVQGRVSRDR